MMRFTIRGAALALAIMVGWCAAVEAQTVDPRTLPRYESVSGVRFAGTWMYDWPDGAGGDISYGGGAVGFSEDGKAIYVSCVSDHAGLAKLEVPAIGGRARVLAPCLGPRKADIAKVHPDPNAFRPMLGGVLELNGRMTVAGYISYDADGGSNRSHWSGPDLSTLTGPWAGTVPNGMVKSQMGIVPVEWRALLGGPAYATTGYTSIISRASYGAAVTIFDPATVTANGFPMTTVLGCRHNDPGCNTYGSDAAGKNNYQGAESAAAGFFIPGTRSYGVMERESDGPACYGYATRNKADHGKPYLDAVYCYSLSDPLDQKGPKGYPYRLVIKLYDVNEWVAVKQGTKKPWEIRQYATLDLPGSDPGEYITSGAFNPATGQFHLWRYTGGGVNTVYVYEGFPKAGQSQTPTPVDCAGTWSPYVRVPGSETPAVCPASGTRQFTEERTFTVLTPASNGGNACPASPERRSLPEACTPPPPPPTVDVSARVREFNTGTRRLTLQYPAGAPLPSLGGVTVFVNGLSFPGAVVSITPDYYPGTPRGTRVIVHVPDLPFLSATVTVP